MFAGTVGSTAWASDANVTVTEGHGGTYPTGLNFSPRNWNGTVHYGDQMLLYTLMRSTGDTTEDLTNVTSGTYSVTVTGVGYCNNCIGYSYSKYGSWMYRSNCIQLQPIS